MKKKLVSLFLVVCMALPTATTVSAAETAGATEVSILDIAKEDADYVTDVAVSEDGVVTTEDGDSETFNDYFDVSLFDSIGLDSEDDRTDYLEDNGYKVTESDDGVLVTDQFQTARLYTTDASACDKYGAQTWAESNGVYFVQYSDSEAAKDAYDKLTADGADVHPDAPIGTTDSYSYKADQVGQYGYTIRFVGNSSTVNIQESEDIMNLQTGASRVVSAQSSTSINTINVAVVDTGVDTTNSIFSGRTVSGYSAVGSSTNDTCTHGTHVASIILNNTPSNVNIIPVKVSENGSFTLSNLTSVFQWCAQNTNKIDVVNVSLTVSASSESELSDVKAAIDPYINTLYNAGITVIAAAGNTSSNGDRSSSNCYPASNDKVISVSNITDIQEDGSRGSWGLSSTSRYGSNVDFCAPGSYIRGIKSTTATATELVMFKSTTGEYINVKDGTILMTGTSQSAPMVTSALAQILSYNNTMSASAQFDALKGCASKSLLNAGSGKDNYYGYGYPDMSSYTWSGSNKTDTSTDTSKKADTTEKALTDNWSYNFGSTGSNEVVLTKYVGTDKNFVVPVTYTYGGKTYAVKLKAGAFANNSSLESVVIADGVTVEDNDASRLFYNCPNLKTISGIPEGVTDISNICYGDSSLTTLPTVLSTVKTMTNAFYGCTKASGTQVIKSDNVTKADGAYTNDSVNLQCTAGSTTYKTLEALLANWPNVTINKTDSTTDANYEANKNKSYTITFHYRNRRANRVRKETKLYKVRKYGKAVNAASVRKVKRPVNYSFKGWYTLDENGKWVAYDFSTPVTSNLDLYAKWTPLGFKKGMVYSATKNGSKVKVTFKQFAKADGYQIRIKTKWGSVQTVNVKNRNQSYCNLKYKGASTYTVKIRGWKKVNGVKYYGQWSNAYKVKL